MIIHDYHTHNYHTISLKSHFVEVISKPIHQITDRLHQPAMSFHVLVVNINRATGFKKPWHTLQSYGILWHTCIPIYKTFYSKKLEYPASMIHTSPCFSKFYILQPSDKENHKYMSKYVNTDSTCIVDSGRQNVAMFREVCIVRYTIKKT